MPLPRFDPDDAPTSTWGGTMIGIPRAAKNAELAWRLVEHLYLSDAGLEARLTQTNILPPLKEQWSHPAFLEADPFFGGQQVNALYAELAERVPARFVTPVTRIAFQQLSVVLNRAVAHVRDRGPDGVEEACAAWLADAADDLRRRIRHGTIEEPAP